MVEPGEILGGKYQAERVIGHGGMGLVIAARHLHLDQRVAIKMLNPEHLSQPAIVDRFLREARASVRLRSEHVARVLDAGQFPDGMPYLVMEYLEGRDLAAELAEHRHLPLDTAVDYLLQVCEAVAEAHQAGIIHRDLKPANMFVTRDAEGATLIKVLDFGISKLTDDVTSDLTRTKMVMGSPPYMSPEQLRTSRNVDVRSDIWSLGVVLYELVSGRRPFIGETLTDLLLRIAGDPFEPLPINAPPGINTAIARCLAKTPADRFHSVAELATALAPFGGYRGFERADRIRRRCSPMAAGDSGQVAVIADGPRTTLSGASGTFEPRARPRALVIGGIAAAAIAVAAIVMAAVLSPAPSPPGGRAGVPSSRPLQPSETALPPPTEAGSAAPAIAPIDARAAGSAGSAGSDDPALTAGSDTPRAPSRATTPTAPTAKPSVPPARRPSPPRIPAPGSAAPVEDLTKSQY